MVRDWSVRKRAPSAVLDGLGVESPLLAQLLINRGVTSPAEARAFLAPACDDPPDGDALAGLKAAGADATVFIPHRERDGYGLNAIVLERLARDGVGLVITVDCGVSGLVE